MDTKDTNQTGDQQGGAADPDAASPASKASTVCAACGSDLQQWGARGGCLRCLIGFVSAPNEQSLPDASGNATSGAFNRRYGHFEVFTAADGLPHELGRGAMGATYRAHDTVLDCDVALKIIDHSVAGHPASRTRFLREARLAAKLRHPNVASVFQYGEQEGECFYTMELVDGETLEARVQRDGPLPPALALEIITQVTHALAAAEVHGIVHRDLKPTNLMLTTQRGRGGQGHLPAVKVIDFGLAKAVKASSEATGATETRGGFTGTPAFASPEQFEHAENVELDCRSDIYSLGATLWYALCGRTPFTGHTLAEIHARQHDPLPVEQLRARGVPSALETLLRSMLSVDPAARPQSASELLEALQRAEAGLAVSIRPARRAWKLRLAMALTLLAAGALVALWKFGHARSVEDDRSIAVLPFENLSPDPNDTIFAVGMQDEIITNLAHVSAMKVIGIDSTRGYPPGKRDFARIGRELGVGRLLTGSVRREQGQVRVNVQLVDPRDPGHPWSGAYVRPLADVFVVQSEITRAITEQLQTPLSAEEQNAINEPPTTDLVAYDLYLQARESKGVYDSAAAVLASILKQVSLLEAAVARDPKFVLAHCELAGAHDNFYEFRDYASQEQQAVDHRALAETALENARRLRPDAGELHLATGIHFLLTGQDNEQARLELDLARKTLPNSTVLERTAARAARGQGRWEEAVRAGVRAVELDPRDAQSVLGLAQTYLQLRRYDDFEREKLRLIALQPPSGRALGLADLASVRLARTADLAPLRVSLAAVRQSEYNVNFDLLTLALRLFERDPDGVSRVLAAAPVPVFTVAGSVHPKGWYEGLAARMRGDTVGAHAAFAAARSDAEKAVLMYPTNGLHLAMLAMIDAGLGRKEDAVREGLRACEITSPAKSAARAVQVQIRLAVVYAWTDQPDLAIAKLEQLVRGPSAISVIIQPSFGDFELNPVWDPLRDDPRFAALKQTLAPTAPPERSAAK